MPFWRIMKMNKPINSKLSGFVLMLTLLISVLALITILPAANAAVVEIDTNAYIMLSPNPVGIGQQVLVSYRIDKVKIGATDVTNHFEDFSVTIAYPDGTTETRVILNRGRRKRIPNVKASRELAEKLRGMTLRVEFAQ